MRNVLILYFADIRFPLERANGIQTMETCHALGRKGHRVALVVRPDTHRPQRDPFEYYGLDRIARLSIRRAPAAGPPACRRLIYLASALLQVLGRARADVLVTRDLGVASLLMRLPRWTRAPLVYESHGFAPEVAAALPGLVAMAAAPDNAKLRRLERREAAVWRDAEGYVTITAGLADQMTARYGTRGPLAVVPDGTRLGPVAPAQGTSTMRADRPVVAYAGHLYAWKGVDVLLRALAHLPDVMGLIIGGHEGEPDLARLKSLAAELGLAGRVTFTGLVAPADVPRLLCGADVLALPNPATAISMHFTSPLKLFEYMAAGRAIVASDLPAIREVLRDGANALLVPPGDPVALASAVRRLLDDPALGARLAHDAAATVVDYTWDRRAERLEALFNQVTRA